MYSFVIRFDTKMLYTQKDNMFVLMMICIFYMVIFVFGLVGNLRVICSVLRHKSNRTVTNVFMSNLAVANILLCLFVLPTFPASLMTNSWPQDSVMCQLWPCVYYSVCYVSVFTLTSISLFRRWTIVHSLEQTVTKTILMRIIFFIWSVSMLISLPRGIFKLQKHVERFGENRVCMCLSEWPSNSTQQNYLIMVFIIMLSIPLFAIFCCFIDISSKLSCPSTIENSTEIHEHARTNRQIIIMTIVFGVCWMPINIIELIPDVYKSTNSDIALRIADAMATSSTCFNPMFYAWLNKVTINQFFVIGPCCDHPSNQSNNKEITFHDTSLPTYDEAVTYNTEVDSALINYATNPPPTYGAAIMHLSLK